MITGGSTTWLNDLAAGQKQPIYAFQVPGFGITLLSTITALLGSGPGAPGTPSVKQYFPGDYNAAVKQTLAWLTARPAGAIGNWLGNAALTEGAVNQELIESGLDYLGAGGFIPPPPGVAFGESAFENITLNLPSAAYGQFSLDFTGGPDGFPINEAAIAAAGPVFANTFGVTTPAGTPVSGSAYNLNPAYSITAVPLLNQAYRVDLYAVTDQLYYQGSAWLTVQNGAATWSIPYTSGPWTAGASYLQYQQIQDPNTNIQQVRTPGRTGGSQPVWNMTVGGTTQDGSVIWVNTGTNLSKPGTVVAALYRGGAPPGTIGFATTALPAGWLAHSNTGVGQKLSSYFARLYVKTDIEYLMEDNVPIVVQDNQHARCGSSVLAHPGTPTVHIIYQDPVAGNIAVFTSLQVAAAYQNLVRSFSIPTSDPLFVADITKSSAPALQNRGFIYDQGLAIIAFCAAGNFSAAKLIIKQLNVFIDTPSYLASNVLENAEDGSVARWSKSSSQDTLANVAANSMTPQEPPYGAGNVIEFIPFASGEFFTYVGSGFRDTTDTQLSFEHYEPPPFDTVFTISAYPVGAVRSNGVSTITTTAVHGFTVGMTVVVAGVTDPSFNGTFTITAVTAYTFTYAQTGMPNSTSGSGSATGIPITTFIYDVGVTSSSAKVTDIQVTSSPVAAATIAGTIITVPIGPGTNNWRTTLLNLQSLILTLSGDNLTSITSFKVTLKYAYNLSQNLGPTYIDNLSVGGLQPAGSLSFSYDIYYGQIDQAYIRTGAMAWVCYAYALYMQLSGDYATPALHLQTMINFIETLKSTASDLTNSLYYLGWGKYQDPGYQFIAGKILTISTEHNIDVYFAWQRASQILPTAASALLAAGTISSSQATSLNATATTVAGEAATIATQLFANIYLPPGSNIAGGPGSLGHFAQGATGNVLDTSQAVDASGAWAAIFCHVAGDDVKALQCLEFVYQTFYLTNQTIQLSNVTSSWNEAYQESTPFSGFETYQNSPGGYSGVPASVWQEGTWGVILMLLDLYNVAGVQSYFTGLGTTIDAVLKSIISDQVTVMNATAGTPDAGALLAWSLAARALPWEFEVWPMFSPTAWWYIVSVNPSLLLSIATGTALTANEVVPYLLIPAGGGQAVDELNGSSSVSRLSIDSIDPNGTVKNLIAQSNFIGQVCNLSIGFAGIALSSFVTVETRQVSESGWAVDGKITISSEDVQRFIANGQIWLNGGPSAWIPGQAAPPQPVGPLFVGANAHPVSNQNPRYMQGNPLDIYLVAMQNELGIGQAAGLPKSKWQLYQPGVTPNKLINPNPYIDVPQVLNLQSGIFSGDWFEFTITSPHDAKQWLEDEILKPLGLYHIVRANGLLSLKPMKSNGLGVNSSGASPVALFNDKNIIGLPEIQRWPVINYLTLRFNDQYQTGVTQAAQKWAAEVTYQQTTSIAQYKQFYKHQIEAQGLRLERGGLLRGGLIADRVFRRHAFATPKYKVKTMLSTLTVEVGDYVYLTHRLMPDLQTGLVGLNGVVCEVVDRKPNYAQGYMEFEVMDTRFMSLTKPYQVAPLASSIPAWQYATPAQRQQYMFISLASLGGENPDGSPGNTIF
jgi:hypothetical protein